MQRRQWLEEALEAISSSPTESQLLQTAITVLRVSVCAVHFTACLYNHTCRYNTSRIMHVAMFTTTLYMTLDVSLQAHMPEKEGKGGGMEEEEERNLLKAFEETRYLVEDLDHANGKPPSCERRIVLYLYISAQI